MGRPSAMHPKDCSNCGKPVEERYWKYGRTCRACRTKGATERNRKKPELARAAGARWRKTHPRSECVRRWRRMGVRFTLAEYDAMFRAQAGRCAICRTDKPGGHYRFFHLDHDHGFGHVRGLLCSTCNRALGSFKDSPALLRAAAKYIETHQPRLKLAGGN